MSNDPITAIETSGDKHGTINVSAAQAHIILDERGFELQRDADHVHIANIADLMESGEWVGASMLTFAKNGDGRLKLVDGQHRLRGFVEYARRAEGSPEMDFTIQVVTETPPEAYALLDSMQKKRPASVIGKALCLAVPDSLIKNALSAAAYALLYTSYDPMYKIGERGKKVKGLVPYRERRNYIDARREAFSVLGGRVLIGLTKADSKVRTALLTPRVMPVCIETIEACGEEAIRFWRGVATNHDPTPVQSILREALLATLSASRPYAASHKARMAAQGWNARKKERFSVSVSLTRKPDSVELDTAEYNGKPVMVLP